MASGLSAQFTKRHGGFVLEFALSVAPGVTALVGPSGSGKTTAIRCLAGLEQPEAGRILLGEEVWFGGGVSLPPQARRVGFVFQDYALFPHLSVAENVAFGARTPGRAEAALGMLGVAELASRRPGSLSAGQQQRVALARAIASEPRLLLLDEPFSSLDAALKERLYGEFARLLAQLAIPVVIVTHDLREASLLANTMAVIDGGRCLQVGAPRDVFFRPASPVVAELAGIRNNFEGVVAGNGLQWGPYTLPVATGQPDGRRVGWCVRPEQVAVSLADPQGLPARVTELALAGATYRVRAEVAGAGAIEAAVDVAAFERLGLAPGGEVRIALGAVHVFPAP